MKREQPPKYNGDRISLTKVWNLFEWTNCVICRFDFRRERGWRHVTHSFRAKWRYVCRECCPTENDATEAVQKVVKDERARMLASVPNVPSLKPHVAPVRVIKDGNVHKK